MSDTTIAVTVLLVFAAAIGLIPASIAHSKGRSFGVWWFYGATFFPMALVHAVLIRTNKKAVETQRRGLRSKKCPYCAEMIQREAIVCRYCGRDL